MNGTPSDEEDLVREAVAQIHRWLEKRAAASRNSMVPRLAVKFCGGCNPSFDRAAVARMIRRDVPDVSWVLLDEEADLLIIINGCLGSCAERGEVQEIAPENLVIRYHSVSTIHKKGSI